MCLGERSVEDLTAFWRDRRALVTGHTGFKGAWLSLWLQSLGAKVAGFALAPPTSPSLFDVARVAEGMTSTTGDVRDAAAVARAVAAHAPSVVFHLAAQSIVRRSYDEPLETFSTNVLGTATVLDAVRRTPGVSAVVVVTSDKCYENDGRPAGYTESAPLGGHDPYSASKACAEIATTAYRRSFFGAGGAAVATARAGNVIGGGDWARDRLVPDLVRAFAEGRPALVRHPDSVRPWQHVLMPLSGYLCLAQRLATEGARDAEAWNFGPADEDARTVAWVADRLAGQWGDGAAWSRDGSAHPHEAPQLRLDSAKARARLGWRPAWTLETALARTVEWHRAHRKGADMKRMCFDQIAEAYR